MSAILLSMATFAFIGAASPGPVNIIATSSGVNFGFRKTLPHVIGASVCYGIIVFLAGIGINQLDEYFEQIAQSLKYIGALFLFYMSYKIATAKASTQQEQDLMSAPTLLQGAMSQGLNPKAWLVSMSGISVFVATSTDPYFYLYAFSGLSFVICLIGISLWAIAGDFLRALLTKPEQQIVFNRLMGVLLALSVVSMFI
jgi:threonine/homoserine/homoserine lactone efflux protein